jgi:ketosteroid isomerase-like protein
LPDLNPLEPLEVVHAWHAALNAGDVERLVELSTEDVEVGGPRGVGRGSQLLREWFDRAGVTIEPLQVIEDGALVVVEQRATWQAASDEPQVVASVFVVRDGRVASVVRYPSLADALKASRNLAP